MPRRTRGWKWNNKTKKQFINDVEVVDGSSNNNYIVGDGGALTSQGSVNVIIDNDNNATDETFKIKAGSSDILTLTEDGNLTIAGTMNTDGDTTLSGNTTIGDATSDTLTVTARLISDIVPSTNDARNLGSASLQMDTVFTNNIHMHNAYHSHASTTTTTATTQVAVDSWSATTYRSAEYFILCQNTTDGTYHAEKILVLHDGTDTYLTTYGTLISDSVQYTATSDISGGNVRLLITPGSTDSMNYRFIAQKHLI